MIELTCKGLLFDMDGVLVDSTPAVARVWARWAVRHNVEPGFAVQMAHGRPSLASIQELLPHVGSEAQLAENDWMEQAEIEDVADVVALPGARELLSALAPGQFAVVTSATGKLAEVRLRAAGLSGYVRNLVSATDIMRGKPAPEPYLKGAATLGLPSAACVVIEDAASGTRSGKSAGSRVVAVRTTSTDKELIAAGADWLINDCSAVRIQSANLRDGIALALDTMLPPRTPKME
jgi:mannitol-1-/sugar-/sorbitol-6-phosphatase